MKFLTPLPTLIVGVIIGAVVIPRVLPMVKRSA